MKQRGYIVRVEKDSVSVEHRASLKPLTIVLLVIGYLGYCALPNTQKIFISFYKTGDTFIGLFALLILLIPFLYGVTWFFFASGEVMLCDAKELFVARRRTWGRWKRFHFSSPRIKELRKAQRGRRNTRHYTVLTFQYDERKYDMLENLSREDMNRVLDACKSMGLDVDNPPDPAEAMMSDIKKRGWFINPLKTDNDESSHSNK